MICVDQETKRPLEMILECKKCGLPKYKSSLINFSTNWDLKRGSTTLDYCEGCTKQTIHVVKKKGLMAPIVRLKKLSQVKGSGL